MEKYYHMLRDLTGDKPILLKTENQKQFVKDTILWNYTQNVDSDYMITGSYFSVFQLIKHGLPFIKLYYHPLAIYKRAYYETKEKNFIELLEEIVLYEFNTYNTPHLTSLELRASSKFLDTQKHAHLSKP